MVQVSYVLTKKSDDKIRRMAKKHFRSLSKEVESIIDRIIED